MKRILLFVAFVALSACGRSVSGPMPESAQLDSTLHARGFTVARMDDCVVVDLRDPWDTLKLRHRYVLASKTALAADASLRSRLQEVGDLIPVPVERAAVYSSVHSSMLAELGCLDAVSGVCEPEYISSRTVLSRVENGLIADLGSSMSPDIERMMDLNVEVIIASPFENGGYGAAEKLGIPIVEAADYMENHPLGRTEWVRFFGMLFGCEEKADSAFMASCSNYDSLKSLASDVAEDQKPTVLLEKKYGAVWHVPSQGSYIGVMHRDAGARYVFSDIDGTNARPMNFESVYERGEDSDFWLFKGSGAEEMTYTLLGQEYRPYSNFKAFRQKNIFACNTVMTSYYDDIVLHPDWVLSDLISIYHPELLPGYRRRYYFPLGD